MVNGEIINAWHSSISSFTLKLVKRVEICGLDLKGLFYTICASCFARLDIFADEHLDNCFYHLLYDLLLSYSTYSTYIYGACNSIQ